MTNVNDSYSYSEQLAVKYHTYQNIHPAEFFKAMLDFLYNKFRIMPDI